jgi:hypothetical protein
MQSLEAGAGCPLSCWACSGLWMCMKIEIDLLFTAEYMCLARHPSPLRGHRNCRAHVSSVMQSEYFPTTPALRPSSCARADHADERYFPRQSKRPRCPWSKGPMAATASNCRRANRLYLRPLFVCKSSVGFVCSGSLAGECVSAASPSVFSGSQAIIWIYGHQTEHAASP